MTISQLSSPSPDFSYVFFHFYIFPPHSINFSFCEVFAAKFLMIANFFAKRGHQLIRKKFEKFYVFIQGFFTFHSYNGVSLEINFRRDSSTQQFARATLEAKGRLCLTWPSVFLFNRSLLFFSVLRQIVQVCLRAAMDS